MLKVMHISELKPAGQAFHSFPVLICMVVAQRLWPRMPWLFFCVCYFFLKPLGNGALEVVFSIIICLQGNHKSVTFVTRMEYLRFIVVYRNMYFICSKSSVYVCFILLDLSVLWTFVIQLYFLKPNFCNLPLPFFQKVCLLEKNSFKV